MNGQYTGGRGRFDMFGLEIPFAASTAAASAAGAAAYREADAGESLAWLDFEEPREFQRGWHEMSDASAGELDEEAQMTWQETDAAATGVCRNCGSAGEWSSEAWPDREATDEAEGEFERSDFEGAANLAGGTELIFEEGGYGEFETPGASPFALVRAIPDNADYARFVPLDYKLNAKEIVGKLPGDLQQLKDPSAKDLKKFAEQVYKFVGGGSPVGLMVNLLVGALKNIPGGYLAAAGKIAEDWAARGLSRGIALGAARKTQSYLIETFGHDFIPPNNFFPQGRKIAAANYGAGLVAGYVQGKAISKNQYTIFWRDIGRRMGDQSYRGAPSAWSDKQWQEWYVDVAAAFRRYHL